MRLLHCNVCHSIDEIPDYEGHEEVDPLVEKVVAEHNKRDPMAHGGAATLPMRLAHVDDMDYAYSRDEVLARLREEGKAVGFEPWVGEAINTFQEDAMRCYRNHHRPKEGCIDWRDDSKRIGRPTSEGQKAVKENYKIGSSDPYLCDFCPVKSWVQTQVNFRKGYYKEK
jgi:hypothetical protein